MYKCSKTKKIKKKNSVKKNSVGKNSIKKNSIIKKKSILPSPTKIVSIKSNTPILQLTLGNKIAKELSSPNKSPLKKVKEIDNVNSIFPVVTISFKADIECAKTVMIYYKFKNYDGGSV